MLHRTHNKPRFPRTKRFEIVYTRNKPVTSNFIFASEYSRTLTDSRAQNRKPRIANDSANHVAVMLQPCNTPRSQNHDFPERNTQSATRQGCSNATRNFYFASNTRTSRRVEAIQKAPTHVRVFSEYSDIQDQTNLDFPEQNQRFPVDKRKSTLTSFFICAACSSLESQHQVRHVAQRIRTDRTERSASSKKTHQAPSPRRLPLSVRVVPPHGAAARSTLRFDVCRKYHNAPKSYTACATTGERRLPVAIHNPPKYTPTTAATTA
jgi:hypothetical protein